MRIALVAIQQRHIDPGRGDYSLAVWRLKAAMDRACPEHPVTCHDLTHDEAARGPSALLDDPPAVVGLSCNVWNVRAMERLGQRLRRRRADLLLVAGGPAAPYFVRSGPAAVDCVVPGEGEDALAELVRALASGGRDALASVPGLLLARDDGLHATAPRSPIQDLDRLPSAHAARLVRPRRHMLLEAARGCPFSCAFCSAPTHQGARVRRFGPDYLARDMAIATDLGLERVFFIEPTLNLGTRRLAEVQALMTRADPDGSVGYFLEISPDTVTDEQIAVLSRMPGKLDFGVGLQTLEPDALQLVGQGRGRHGQELRDALRSLDSVGDVMVEIILGLPGDTPEGFRRTLAQVATLGMTAIVFRLVVAPGTELWRQAAALGLEYDDETFLLRRSPTFTALELDREEDHAVQVLERAVLRGHVRRAFYSASDQRMHAFE